MFRGKRKFIVIGAVGVAGIVAAGTAYALWTANGSGSGSSKALSAQAITVTASTGAADLYPGFTGGDLSFTLSNPNPYPVTFTSLVPGSVSSSNTGACAASNVSVTNPVTVNLSVAAGATNVPFTVSDVVSMASGALDGCQGITFTVPVTLTGSQS
ncbi:MAG: hypothetical protein LC792_14075 [Actinobacteria bacterium]|nr:hypothetical protein [Actinomycetota bacterium]